MKENRQPLVKYVTREITGVASSANGHRYTVPARQITLADVRRMVTRRKLVILGFAALVFGASAAYAFLKKPLYEGVARVQIDPTRSSNLGLDGGDKSISTDIDSHVATEVTIIHSNAVAKRVMETLNLYSDPNFAGKDAPEYKGRRFSELSPTTQEQLFAKFNENLTVRVLPNTQIVEIRFRNSNPAVAAQVANSVIDEYMQRNFHSRVDGAAQISQWLSTEMDDIKSDTTVAQQKLAEFQKVNNLLGPDESDNIVTNRLKQLNEELTQAEAERIVKEGRYQLAHSSNPELIATIVPSATLQILRTQQADLQRQYAELSAKFGDGYPKLRELQSQLDHLNTSIQAEDTNIQTRLGNEYSAASNAEAMIRFDFEKQKADAYKLNEHAAQYATLKHEVESGQQLYDTLQLKLKEAGIASGLNSSYIGLIDTALLPDRPIEPRKGYDLALGLASGLLGGLLLGFVLDSFDDTIKSSEELESMTDMPELTSVPFLEFTGPNGQFTRSLSGQISAGSKFNPISAREPNCPGAEAYRALASMALLSKDPPPKVVVVTSAMPGEGKSTVSSNLATTLAQRGRRVLLVDADLRCSSFQLPRGFNSSLGNMNVAGSSDPPSRFQPLSGLPNLEVVPAGARPTDPAGILDSARMHELMQQWSAEYDHVIVDTPPVLPFADALLLAARADAVILVTRSGVSRTKALLRARDVLARSGANIMGFVLNAVRNPEYYYAFPADYTQLRGSEMHADRNDH